MGHGEVIPSSSRDTGAVLGSKLLTPDSCPSNPLLENYTIPRLSPHS